MDEPILQVQSLAKRFGALAATDDVSLSLNAGEIHALIGPNGAGKSTLIGQIAGWITPDAGRVIFAGRDVTALTPAARARAGLGRSFQISTLALELSARRNVMIAAQGALGRSFSLWRSLKRDRALIDAADAALARVGLSGVDRPTATLSHGERRLVELAAALALKPKALLLDEPMAGLGAEGAGAMTELLRALARDTPILLVEHDMDAVFALARRVTVLVDGRVVASGDAAAIRANAEVRAAYLGDAEAALGEGAPC